MLNGTTSEYTQAALEGGDGIEALLLNDDDGNVEDDCGPAPGPTALSSVELVATPRESIVPAPEHILIGS